MLSSHTSLVIQHSGMMKYMQCTLVFLLGFMLHTVTSFIESSDVPNPSPDDIRLFLVSSCGNSAKFYWNHPDHQRLSQSQPLCELTVYETGQLDAQIFDIYPDSTDHYIKLNNLRIGQSYSAFIVCNRTTKTRIIKFTYGALCENKIDAGGEEHRENTTIHVKENVTVEVLHSNDINTVGLFTAVIFSFIAVVLIVSVAYFMWKKYQHRQRILRIFRQEQNDPFQALYIPAQDAYSV